jgi:hypothetical protein
MPSRYKAVLIGSDGKILDMIDLPLCSTERLAVDAARTFPGRHATVEVWDGGRMVGSYEPTVLRPRKPD